MMMKKQKGTMLKRIQEELAWKKGTSAGRKAKKVRARKLR